MGCGFTKTPKKLPCVIYTRLYYKVSRRVLQIIKTIDWKKKKKREWVDEWTLDGLRRDTQRPVLSVILTLLLFPFSLVFVFCSARRDEEADRDDAASDASRLVILEAQVLLRIVHRSRAHRRSRAETHPRHRSNGYGDAHSIFVLFHYYSISFISLPPYPLELIAISWYFEMEREILSAK